MRGIEGALVVLEETERGAFAAESLRRVWSSIEPPDRKLAGTIVYLTLRKYGLWRHLLGKFCKRPLESLNRRTLSILIAGIAGVLELQHFKPAVLVNALVQQVKSVRDENGEARDAALVNAVLRSVMAQAPTYVEHLKKSSALRDQALANGVPGWVAAEWNADWGMKETKRLIGLSEMQTYLSLRIRPGADRDAWIGDYAAHSDVRAFASDFISTSIRLEANPYPPDLPGYESGAVTPQSESSMWAVENFLAAYRGGEILDMCMGRGVKAGQILTALPEATFTGWDLSARRLAAAEHEFARLGVAGRARVFAGDALLLTPASPISAILLDAPCSGSGTWGRHPEGKWRLNPAKLEKASALQSRLLARAADLLTPGGFIMYCTCSTFRSENEKVVGDVMSSRSDLVEVPVKVKNSAIRKGKPYGALMMPESPWIDGFYIAIFRKKS